MSSYGTRNNRPQYNCSHVLRYLVSFAESNEATPRQISAGPTWDLSELDPGTHDGVTTLRRLPHSQLAKEVNNIFGECDTSAVITKEKAMALARGVLQDLTRHPGSSNSRVIVDGTRRPYTLQVAAEKIVPNDTSIIGDSVAPVDSTVYEEDPVVWMRPRVPTGATIPTIIPFTALKSELQALGTLRPHDKTTHLTAPYTAGDFVNKVRTWADDSQRAPKLVADYSGENGSKVQLTFAMSQLEPESEKLVANVSNPMSIGSLLSG